jgi:hypothetical protein
MPRRRRPSKASIATLTALLALAAGAQALVPTPAAAEIAENGSTCTLKDGVPTDGNGQLCTIGEEVIPVRDTPDPCAGRSLCLPGMNGVPIPTGGDGSSGEGPGSGSRGGVGPVTKKVKKPEHPHWCARLRWLYENGRSLTVEFGFWGFGMKGGYGGINWDEGKVAYYGVGDDGWNTALLPAPSRKRLHVLEERINEAVTRLHNAEGTAEQKAVERELASLLDLVKGQIAINAAPHWNEAWEKVHNCEGPPPWGEHDYK